jgi:hypothetical protein
VAYDLKYGKVTTEHGNIGEDEPVFVLRARDVTAPKAIIAYIKLVLMEGAPMHHVRASLISLERFRRWQSSNRDQVRVPKSASTSEATLDEAEEDLVVRR